MNEQCVISPDKGKKLHSKCIASFGRELGTRVFLLGINPKFNTDYKNSLSVDAEGVPLFDSLLKNKMVRTYIGENTMLEFINNSLKNTRYEDTNAGFQQALKKAEEFNTTSDYRKDYIVFPEVMGSKEDSSIVLKAEKKSDVLNQQFADASNSVGYRESVMTKAQENSIAEQDIEDTIGFLGSSSRSVKGLDNLLSSLNSLSSKPDEGIAYLVSKVFQSEPQVQRTRHYILAEDIVSDILDENGYPHSDVISEEDIDVALGFYLLGNNPKPPVAERASALVRDRIDEWDFNSLNDASRKAHMGESTYLSLPYEEVSDSGEIIDNDTLDALDTSINNFKSAIYKLETLEAKKVNTYDTEFAGMRALSNRNIVQGLSNYFTGAIEELRSLQENLNKLGELSFQEQCKTVKRALDYSKAYDMLFTEIQKTLFGKKSILSTMTDNEALKALSDSLDNIIGVNAKVLKEAGNKAVDMFTEFMRTVIGDNITTGLGESRKEISIEDLVAGTDKDISMLSRWLDSAGNSSDTLLQGAHLAIKRQKDKARIATLRVMERAIDMGTRAEKAGLKDFTFMYEVDGQGHRTGNYISEFRQAEYIRDREAYKKQLMEDNRNASAEDRKRNVDKGMKEWHKNNSEATLAGYIPNNSYRNKQYDNMTQVQRAFYNEFMEIKKSLDALIPDGETYLENAIKIRKGVLDRVLSSKNPFKQIQEAAKDALMDRSDDTEFGIKGNTDLAGNEVHTIPVYYVKMSKNESADDLTNDIVGALIQYAYMANNYNAMSQIVEVLELGREAMKRRQVNSTRGNKTVVESIRTLGLHETMTVPKSKTEIEALYNEMLESQVFGIYIKDNGTIGNTPINANKAASLTLRAGSSIQLGFNFLAGMANAVNGLAMQNIEAVAREFFSAKELRDADAYYMKHMHKMVGELGTRAKTNELDIIFRFFNVKQDFDKETKGIDFNKRNFILKMFGPSVLYLYQTIGDNFLYGRSALAMLIKEKVMKDGKEMSLIDALGFENIGLDENSGRTLSLKGIKKKDGSDFTMEDVSRISRKMEYVNQKCFGVYNNEDINAARRTVIGRFLLQYRDWMRPAFMRRFQRTHYNALLEEDREGYYISGLNFLKILRNDLKKGQLNIMRSFKSLDAHRQANVRRCVVELAQYLAVLALVHLIDWPDDEVNWASSMIEYTLRRQQTELGSVIPGPPMFTEGFKILKSPMANISVMESTFDLLELLYNPEVYTKEMKSGYYKGHSKAYKIVMDSPIGLQTKNIRRMLDPSDAIDYLKNQ